MTDTPSKQSVYSEETITQSLDGDEASITPSDEETGAPIETVSPLGYHVDWISVIFLVSSSRLSLSYIALNEFRMLAGPLELESSLLVGAAIRTSLRNAFEKLDLICSGNDPERSRERRLEFNILGGRVFIFCWCVLYHCSATDRMLILAFPSSISRRLSRIPILLSKAFWR